MEEGYYDVLNLVDIRLSIALTGMKTVLELCDGKVDDRLGDVSCLLLITTCEGQVNLAGW